MNLLKTLFFLPLLTNLSFAISLGAMASDDLINEISFEDVMSCSKVQPDAAQKATEHVQGLSTSDRFEVNKQFILEYYKNLPAKCVYVFTNSEEINKNFE